MKKITRVKFYDHPVLGNSEVNLVNEDEFKNDEYISFIIGQNGTGKSKLLEAISLFLTNVYRFHNENDKWNIKYGIEIDIYSDGVLYKLEYKNGLIFSHADSTDVRTILPDNLIVNVFTFNDKYPFVNTEEFYHYCGLRTVSNSIYVNKPTEDCFNNLSSLIQDSKKLKVTNAIFKELNFSKKISVSYLKISNKIERDIRFLKIKSDFKKNQKFGEEDFRVFKSLVKSTISKNKNDNYKIKRFINNSKEINTVLTFLCGQKELNRNNELIYSWEDNLENTEVISNNEFINKIEVFKILREIGILQFDKFQVFRNDYFNFNDASSGEFHFLNLFSSILANIKEASIVIIDEPEISLHPNWQNMLLYILEPLFNAFPKSQFLIASHSHLMVSSLKKSNSTLVTMKKDIDGLIIKNLDKLDTYGWSAEQILFDVFDMFTDRNYYLSLKVQKIINEMSSLNPNEDTIEQLKIEIKGFNIESLHNEDPFKSIIKSILK